MTRLRWALRLGLILLAAGLAALAQAAPMRTRAAEGDISMKLWAGLDGKCKTGLWLPLRVLVENKGGDVEASLETSLLSYTKNSTVYSTPISLPAGGRKQVFLYVFPGTGVYLTQIEVRLVAKGATLSSVTRPVSCSTGSYTLVGVAADTPSAFNVLPTALSLPTSQALLADLKLDDLPDRSRGLSALDVLVISGVDSGVLSAAQRQALALWVANGGQLIITGGPNWQKTAAGLGELLPISVERTVSLEDLSALVTFASAQTPLTGAAVVAVGKPSDDAEILASQDGYPLLLSRRFGVGTIYYLAVDPALIPLRNWQNIGNLYRNLLSRSVDRPGWSMGFRDWNMASQAVSTLPGLSLPSVVTFCSFLCLYVLVLGPLNFLLLVKLKRRELTWITIPSLVVFFTLLALALGNQSRGNLPIVNQLAIVQAWPDVSTARVDGLVGVYSPRRASYRLEVGQSYLAHPLETDNSNGDWMIIEQEQGATFPKLNIDSSGLSGIAVEGYTAAPRFSHTLKIVLSPSTSTLEGHITNESELTLEDAVILAAGDALSVGTFAPGQSRYVRIILNKSQQANQLSWSTTNLTYLPYPGYSPYYYGTVPNTVAEILGNSNYYDDKETYQRFNLIASTLGGYSENLGRGGGVTLAGWSKQTPLEVELSSKAARSSLTTLYLIAFEPTLELRGDLITLSPGMFSWNALDATSGSSISPYNSYLYPNSQYILQFNLCQPIAYQKVNSMILNIKSSSSTGSSPLIHFKLWDENLRDWVEISNLVWGANQIADPERFVAPGGIIRLQVDNQSSNYYNLDVVDLTLTVER